MKTNEEVFPWIQGELDAAAACFETMRTSAEILGQLHAICAAARKCLQQGGCLYTFGNGGSAADALHLAEELVGRYRSDRNPLRAQCFNADVTALTCIANDYGLDQVFARPVEAFCGPKDMVVGFSTSGNSENVNKGLQKAREKGACVAAMLGGDGGAALPLCDHAFVAPAKSSDRIQECHGLALHMICLGLEDVVPSPQGL